MSRTPLVSVVIPTFGRPEKLAETLAALDHQECESFEVVVVDDGSPQPVTRAALPDPQRFTLQILRQENQGPAAARNFAAKETKGEILLFTDDDCVPCPGWVSALSQEIESHPEALVGSLTFNGLPGNKWSSASQLIFDLVYEHFNKDPTNAYFLASNNMACRRDLFLRLGGFDTEFPQAGAEDRDFCDRWRTTGRPIRLLPKKLVEHRHTQTFGSFLNLHYRYGRGAYLYQAKRKQRGSGTMAEDLGFHRRLLKSVPNHLRGVRFSAKASRVIGLVSWQVANAVGFLAAATANSRGNSSLRADGM